MEWKISHPQVQESLTIGYDYAEYLTKSESPQLNYLFDDASEETKKQTITWFKLRYGIVVAKEDLSVLKGMLRRDFKRTVDSMR